MSARMARGACPSLSAPMETGDGLLVRLTPETGALDARQLAGIAEAADRFGNGLIEITARGSLQLRGLTATTVKPLADAIDRLDVRPASGIDIRAVALSGLDRTEIDDAGPLADAIRRQVETDGLAAKLAPKVAVTVDGGGALRLGGLLADVRLEAIGVDRWLVSVGGTARTARPLGTGNGPQAVKAAMGVLHRLAGSGRQARGRDLGPDDVTVLRGDLDATPAAAKASGTTLPVSSFPLRQGNAVGIALPFGQVDAGTLSAFADEMRPEQPFRLAPARGLLAIFDRDEERDPFTAIAARHGFITDRRDPRLSVVACAGAPACASARLPTKAIARQIAASDALPAQGVTVHVSGCAKQCARPTGPAISLVGNGDGYAIEQAGCVAAPATLAMLRDAARATGIDTLKADA